MVFGGLWCNMLWTGYGSGRERCKYLILLSLGGKKSQVKRGKNSVTSTLEYISSCNNI